ncbi:GGDEF domain-containing protein [Sulfuritalea hydrogenivorans]|jgi:diguanylate cyclase (GGDEF)-like protein|uniref:diguanylate cyclase n=1 Tax=Sulfuritalea hydrogenivorans sk43H TaxID=1223802 RepID=W0SM27_9PROT|nr:GGDEF domain-containing protein [Sulfuritalea hydrogenivorans]BAO30823.1 cyclic nucleotide-binding protein [Sulfuritalea hydrogenivorans sk43H]
MIDREDRQRLQHAKLFANISLESIEHLLERCHRLDLERGEHLLEAGAANSHLYLILDGELRVYLADRTMPEHAVFGAGDCVGEMSLLDGQKASALVLAAHDTRLLAMPHEVLWALVDCSHGVARNLLAIMAGRMRNDNLAMVNSQTQSLEFEQASSVDALTGIHNRRWLLEAYPRAIGRCERNGESLCLIIADIDLFKRFNDRFGHLAGDGVLRRVARQLADGLRTQDLIARYGGEEFLILLPHAGLDEALLIAERLRDLVAACALETSEGMQSVTLSCGVAQMRKGETLDELTSRADAALLNAKENGRDRVETAE